MDEKTEGNEAKGGYTTPNRQGEYARLAVYLPKAIEELGKLLEHSNANIRLGAINKVLDKCLPDLKAMELTGKDGQPLQLSVRLDMAGGYIPGMGLTFTTSNTSDKVSSEVQGADMAPKSTQDNNSTYRASEADPL